jgi:hypothetical protein
MDAGKKPSPGGPDAYKERIKMMKQGMLWYDDSPRRSLEDKIARASAYYQQKYGSRPNVCYIHPRTLPDTFAAEEAIKVVPAADVLPHHLWLGVADLSETAH